MVFSFFKKKDNEPSRPDAAPELKQPRPAVPPPPVAAPPRAAAPAQPAPAQPSLSPSAAPAQPKPELAPLDFTSIGPSTLSGGRIDVLDSSDVISMAMEQAAISYANDQADDAVSILAEDVKSIEGHHALDTWLMLFDLYQMSGKRTQFDELALQFVVEFERSAPVWQNMDAQKDAKPAPTPAKAGGPSVLFPSRMDASNVNTPLDQIEKLAVGNVPVRLEFSRITDIDAAAADQMVKRWAKFKKAKCKLVPAGGPQLADILRGRIEVMRRQDAEIPYWLLLLEIFQMLGLQEDFENTAVDFAVTFEVSPPSWDVAAKAKTAADVAQEEARLKAEMTLPSLDAYVFKGPIVNYSESGFQNLIDYANAHQTVYIDMAAVPRVDFVSCGMFFNALVQITAQSKQVVIMGANELIVALFRLMGLAEIAKIVRKK